MNHPGFSFEFIPNELPQIPKALIGIDPDTDKSGVAVSENGKITELHNLGFWDLIRFLSARKHYKVFIEAGWLNPSASHRYAENKWVASKMGSKVGANWQTGKLISEFCRVTKIDFVEIRPTARKMSQESFKNYTGWKLRTNQETRDAAMLIFGRK